MSKHPRLRVTWWDRFLVGLAPTWGANRIRARAAVADAARYFDAASGGRRTGGWRRTGGDANAPASSSLVALRDLSRDLRRNNGWAKRGIQVIANNAVGWGIMAKPTGVPDDVAAAALEVWNAWADTSRCEFVGRMTFYGLQRLVMSTVVESGEALVIRQPAAEEDDLPIPLRVQVLEPDYLDLGKTVPADGRGSNRIVQGIELDGAGRRVAYWLHGSLPGAAGIGALESKRVAAEDVLHVYLVDRPSQRRGVPWLAAAIARLNDFDDYSDAVLMQQKIAACFSAFVQDFDGAATPLGTLGNSGDEGAPAGDLESLEPGHIQYLPPGKSITFATPPSVADHATFSATNLRRIAASLGVTYEDLTGDYSQVNFSSGRMARLAHWSNVHDWRWNMLIPQLCDGVWRWVMELAQGMNGWKQMPKPWWSPPPAPMLEPDKEGLAYQRLVRNGVMTLEEMIRERGSDPATHLAEIAAGNAQLDALGIILDSDPRRTSASGGLLPQQAASAGAPADTATTGTGE